MAAAVAITALAVVGVKVVYPMWAVGDHLARAKADLAGFDLPAAEDHIKQVLKYRPDHAEAAYLLAQVYRRTERYAESRKQLDVARRLGWVSEYIQLEELLLSLLGTGPTGQVGDTVRLYISASHPEDRLLMEALTRAYLDSHFLNEARALLDRWVERYPRDWYPRFQRAQILEAVFDGEGALADYRAVLDLHPNHPTVRRMIAGVLVAARKDLDEAARLAEEQVRLHPNDAEAEVRLAEARFGLGRPDDALATVNDALGKRSDLPRGLTLKARLERNRDPAAAFETLKRAEAVRPEDPQVALLLSQLAGELGRTDEAARWLTRHQLLDAEEKRQQDLAVAVRRTPHDPAVRVQVGQSLMAVGRSRDALGWFLSALRENPNHAPTHEALAAYYDGPGQSPGFAAQHRAVAERLKAEQK